MKKTPDKELNSLLLKNEQLEELVTHDFLTKAPNRLFFDRALKAHVECAAQSNEHFALLLLDVDYFKIINDTYGHDIGDEFLKEVAHRIHASLRSNDIFARLGGDEFAVIAENINQPKDAEIIAKKIIEIFNAPFCLTAVNISVTVSIGISFFPDAKDDYHLLLKHADLALYLAKNSGRNQYQLYRSTFDKEQKHNLKLESLLQTVDKDKEFSVVYQAIVDFNNGKIIGLDALLRWKNSEIGSIAPEKFIPLAEKIGKMNVFTAWLIERVALQLSEWKADDMEIIPVSIHLSARDLRSKDVIQLFDSVIKKYHLSADCFQVNVSESVIMQEQKIITNNINALQKLGIFINIINFGAEYFSLFKLCELPIHAVKLDCQWLNRLNLRDNNVDLIEAIILFAKRMHFRVIAEGIKTQMQFDLLRKCGCEFGEGNYFLKPMGLSKIKSYLKTNAAIECGFATI